MHIVCTMWDKHDSFLTTDWHHVDFVAKMELANEVVSRGKKSNYGNFITKNKF